MLTCPTVPNRTWVSRSYCGAQYSNRSAEFRRMGCILRPEPRFGRRHSHSSLHTWRGLFMKGVKESNQRLERRVWFSSPTRQNKGLQVAAGKPTVTCSCALGAEVAVATSLFTLSTAAVMPLYTLMLLAPDRPLTQRVMGSSVPWVVLGGIYAYLLALSWTPLTLPSMFASKYWLPELSTITQLFRSTLTVASAWIHLLALDLYAARNVYFEGLRLDLETRHSIALCLLFAPMGLLCHSITKAIVSFWRGNQKQPKSVTDLDNMGLE